MKNNKKNINELNTNELNISIIIPTFNAEATIPILISQLEDFSDDFQMTIILIDDCSRDNTTAIIEALSKEYNNITYYFSDVNKGQQSSLLAGLKLLKPDCDYVVTMDDDLQNPVEKIPDLINEIQIGYDLVYAIPLLNEKETQNSVSVIRKFGSHLRNLLFDSFIYKPAHIKVSAFRIMTYKLAAKIADSKKKHFYMSAEAFQYKINVSNIFYHFTPRYSGKTSYNFIRLLRVYLRLFFTYKLNFSKQVQK
jgi:undecaprenyl-phosphate 4-deoxy-4-formamido-L-arabinose transferase